MAKLSPCFGCPKRWVSSVTTCHASCKEYLDFKAALPSQAYVKEEAREYRRDVIGKSLNRYRYRREKQGRSPY